MTQVSASPFGRPWLTAKKPSSRLAPKKLMPKILAGRKKNMSIKVPHFIKVEAKKLFSLFKVLKHRVQSDLIIHGDLSSCSSPELQVSSSLNYPFSSGKHTFSLKGKLLVPGQGV